MRTGLELLVSRCRDDLPYVLLFRPEVSPDTVQILAGETVLLDGLDDLGVESGKGAVVALLPFRLGSENRLVVHDDEEPLVALRVSHRTDVDVVSVIDRWSPAERPVAKGDFIDDDDAYGALVRSIVDDEIAGGEGSNFVVGRRWTGRLDPMTHDGMIGLFADLLSRESAAYWTYLVWTGERFLLGASPERHLELVRGVASMSPISGTLRHPASGPSDDQVRAFLSDVKETDELCMVLDEELKMMATVSDGPIVSGPFLRSMSAVTHTEYRIDGPTTLDAVSALRHTLFAPTVVGSPIKNAARVIERRETSGRGYYSGVIALIDDLATLDSAIIIRTIDVDATGGATIVAGATIVRDSTPSSEALETAGKLNSLLSVLRSGTASLPPAPCERARTISTRRWDPLLRSRNGRLSSFWFDRSGVESEPWNLRVRLIDAEDEFTGLLRLHLAAIGVSVDVAGWSDVGATDVADIVLLGPGPGDPNATASTRISAMRRHASMTLRAGTPLLGVCLGHQMIAAELGLPLHRLSRPGQGRQQHIDFFGDAVRVGFYNSFVARTSEDSIASSRTQGIVRVSRSNQTGDVHGLRGSRVESFQFHPESILSPDGTRLLRDAIRRLALGRRTTSDARMADPS